MFEIPNIVCDSYIVSYKVDSVTAAGHLSGASLSDLSSAALRPQLHNEGKEVLCQYSKVYKRL